MKLWALVGWLLVGCAAAPRYQADLSLLVPYDFSLEEERAFAPPYLASWDRLAYVAAAHGSAEPTFRTIDAAFARGPIGAVVVEGIPPIEEDLPEWVRSHAEECAASGYRVNCGEPWYAIHGAIAAGAVVQSGEPSEGEILRAVVRAGFSAQDLLGFYVVRNIPQWKRSGEWAAAAPRDLVAGLIADKNRALGVAGFGFEEFSRWFAAHMPGDYRSISGDDTAPVASGTFVQRISHATGMARDASIVAKIAELVNAHARVLVVYGASHLLVERKVLEKMLGPAKLEKLF